MGKRGVLCLSYPAWASVSHVLDTDSQLFLHGRCLNDFVCRFVATYWTTPALLVYLM